MKTTQYVTRGDWCVSTVVTSTEPGAELHVFKRHERPLRPTDKKLTPTHSIRSLWQFGDGYGKRFETSEQATAWAFEHGYLQVYYRRRRDEKLHPARVR